MALDLNEYIKMSYERPNRKVLEGLGASEDLIEYLMETPGNTNWNMVNTLENSSGGLELPYTFHFIPTEIEFQGETSTLCACNEVDKWMNIWNSFKSGTIAKAVFSNVTYNDEPTQFVFLDNYTYYDYGDEGAEWDWVREVSEGTTGEYVAYYPMSTNNYIFMGNDQISICDITIDIQDGYKLVFNNSELQFLDIVYIKAGNSFEFDNGPWTDGTNTYNAGDIIIPTSDLNLTKTSYTITFYDEYHNLMSGLYYKNGGSVSSYDNPLIIHSNSFNLPNYNSYGELNGGWHDEDSHDYGIKTLVTVTKDTNFTFVQTTI